MNAPQAVRVEQPLILIVDDSPANLYALGEFLVQHYSVRVANGGVAALALAALPPQPDLILLDVIMPDMDGYEVLEQLKADALTASIPVIFLTALDRMEDEEKGLARGAVDYIAKPIRPSIVLARVAAQLELKQARDWLSRQNEMLEDEVARRMAENEAIQDASIHALARLAETRDSETGNHLRRTQEYIATLARHLQHQPRFAASLSEAQSRLLVKSAVLHDIGKVGIPDRILLKPAGLSDEEWPVMRTHARLGAEAIEQAERAAGRRIDFLAQAKAIARWHHEKWDGSGYPDGLKGDEIPVSARLMALADVFDALTTRRVYKPPLPAATAREMIIAERGRHFDPDIVDAFVANYDAFVAIAEQYADKASGEGGETAGG